MNQLRFKILDDLQNKYGEWVEDLGLPREQILITLLEKEKEKNEDLKRRLSRYENS